MTEDAVQLIEDTDRAVTAAFMKLNQYVDVDDSVHIIITRIIKNNNPNVAKDKKNDFINVNYN